MSGSRPLLVSGPARSGTSLLCTALSAHPDLMVASDPYLPYFRSLRNAMAQDLPGFDSSAALSDGYFSDDRTALLEQVLSASLDVPLDPAEGATLVEALRRRAAHASPDLVEGIPDLLAGDYRAMLSRGLQLISRIRGARPWVGFKEAWNVDFFPAISRAFPEARFLVLLRDPRAVVASMLALSRKDPSQLAHPLSYARHCRKYMALCRHWESDTWMRERVRYVRYEDVLRDPRAEMERICEFLDIRYDASMLDGEKWFDYATGRPWTGNSSFLSSMSGVRPELAERWRRELSPEIEGMVSYVCGPEMALVGYDTGPPDEEAMVAGIQQGADGEYSWRSDFRDAHTDAGFELLRRVLLRMGGLSTPQKRRAFLFEDVFEMLKGSQRHDRLAGSPA
ncbi:MAG: sulfotransferase [Armatimonadetes bacterium]|nr:sulfotransferase [Armatimonadota bacterium]